MKKGKNHKGSLVFDIGNSRIGAGVVSFKNGVLVLEKTHKAAIGTGSKGTRDALESEMLKALGEVAQRYAGGDYTDIRIVLSSPWHDAHIGTILSKSEKPEVVSMKSVERLVETYKNEKAPNAGNVDVEAVAVQVQVNNYPTALVNPVQGTHTAINLYESEVAEKLQRSIVQKIQEHVPNGAIAFNTAPLVESAALRAVTLETSFIFVDVGGEVTELGIIHNDAVYYLASIPIGYWTIIRDIGGEQVGDTRSRLALWVKGELTPEESATISEKFTTVFKKWLTEFENILKEASTLVPIPRTLFLVSETEPAGWLKQGIEIGGTMSLSPTIISPALVQRFVEVGEGGSFDVFLCLAAIFFHMGEREVVGEPVPQKMKMV